MRRSERRNGGWPAVRYVRISDRAKRRCWPEPTRQNRYRRGGVGFLASDSGCGARQHLTDADGASRQRPGEVSGGRAALEAPVLSRERAFQQFRVRARRRAIPWVGVPGVMGQQADRSTRSEWSVSRADEPTQCARPPRSSRLSAEAGELVLLVEGADHRILQVRAILESGDNSRGDGET